jgi:hypothetical protein
MRKSRGSARFPIFPISVREATKLIQEKGYKVMGRELVSPPEEDTWVLGTLIKMGQGSCAEHYLTDRQLAKLREAKVIK